MSSLNSFIKKIIGINSDSQSADIDSVATTIRHRDLIQSKPFLKKIYLDHYSHIVNEINTCPDGIKLEIGSGGSFLKEKVGDLITSDILELPYLDKVFSALEIPYPDESLSCICMTDVFHHLPDTELFLKEANRCLKPGGKIIMIEPANTLWGRFFFKYFHHEPFIPDSKSWKLPPGGPMSMANGALPSIVFVRDKKIFEEKFPHLKIDSPQYIHPFRYLLSGGVSMMALVPSWSYPFVSFVEDVLLRPISPLIGMFMRITVEKQKN